MENGKNMDNGSKTVIFDIQKQKNEWRKKGWSIPDIRGGKQIWYTLVKKLVELVDSGQAYDLDSVPDIYEITQPQSWRTYAAFLKGGGRICKKSSRTVDVVGGWHEVFSRANSEKIG